MSQNKVTVTEKQFYDGTTTYVTEKKSCHRKKIMSEKCHRKKFQSQNQVLSELLKEKHVFVNNKKVSAKEEEKILSQTTKICHSNKFLSKKNYVIETAFCLKKKFLS